MAATSEKFFEEQSDVSETKAKIIAKYFFRWAKIVGPTADTKGGKIAYIDLFAGPGRYQDGSLSTPILLLSQAAADPSICKKLVSWFNDNDELNVKTLEQEIAKITGIESLSYKPTITQSDVDEELAEYFNKIKLVPTFSFIDPFGYKGLSLKIIKGVIKDWGCDCVFFFNYSRINAGINNESVSQHIDALFGSTRATELRLKLQKIESTLLREATILEALAAEIKSLGGRYVLPFTFKNKTGKRTKHHLIFVSKHFKGYNTMKSVMAEESSSSNGGVPSLEYSPADISTPLLFSLNQGVDDLEKHILRKMQKNISFDDLYMSTSVDTPFIEKNYRAALVSLESKRAIRVFSIEGKPRRAGTFGPHVRIERFPNG